jgi:hypothetical protein
MRYITLAGAALVLACGMTLSSAPPAQADNYWGPVKVGNQCWKRAGHNSLGYWETCKSSGESANAKITKRTRR